MGKTLWMQLNRLLRIVCKGYLIDTPAAFKTSVHNAGITNVSTIQLFNWTNNCCTSRLSGFYVFLSDTPFASANLNQTINDPNVWSFFHAGAAGESVTIQVSRTPDPDFSGGAGNADEASGCSVQ